MFRAHFKGTQSATGKRAAPTNQGFGPAVASIFRTSKGTARSRFLLLLRCHAFSITSRASRCWRVSFAIRSRTPRRLARAGAGSASMQMYSKKFPSWSSKKTDSAGHAKTIGSFTGSLLLPRG
jgi:hypothetical protein